MDQDGQLAEAVQLPGLEDGRDPPAVAIAYSAAGACELFLDGRSAPLATLTELTNRITSSVSIPTHVATDSSSVRALGELKEAGAGCLVLSASALRDPNFITAVARSFGSDCVAVSIEAEGEAEHWRIAAGPGAPTEWDAATWARVVEAQGGGELVVRSSVAAPDEPFDLELLKVVTGAVEIPVLAAGAAGRMEDVFDALMIGGAQGVLLGSLVHSGQVSLPQLETYLTEHGLPAE